MALALLSAADAWAATAMIRVGTPAAPGRADAAAARGSGDQAAPVTYVTRTDGAIEVDGRLDDKPWARATKLSLDRTLDGTGAASQPTNVLLLRDDENLYVGVRCGEPKMDKVRPGKPGRDVAIWPDDSVEVFIGPAGAKTYYRFGTNVAGAATDGEGKSDSWNSPFRVATNKDKDAWTAEMVIPLAKMSGKTVPVDWIANFNRTRYASGTGEEFAWSPTGSGDSHLPDKFGKLILADPPAQKPAPGATEAAPAKNKPVEVVPVSTGVAVLRLDLSGLPKGAKVYRAELRLFRRAGPPRGAEDALARLIVYPLAFGFRAGVEPKVRGDLPSGPVPLLPPCDALRDRLYATDAVMAWAARRPDSGLIDFFVQTGPPLDLDRTCLDVAYEGEAKNLPPQATGLKVLHRAGQTFITFADREDTFGDRPATWGQIREYFARTDPDRQIRYRVYRHTKRIDAASVKDAELVAEIAPLSAFNVNSWSLERLINQAMFSNDDQGELMKYGPFGGWNRNSAEGGRLVIPRFAIEDGKALPPGTGLCVYSGAEKKGAAYYAVTASANGIENLAEFAAANSLAKPVDEAPGTWEPVEQPESKPFGFDYRGRRHYYVQWAGEPLAPKPMYFNWSVLVPPDDEGPAPFDKAQGRPVELYFHEPGYSYARPPVKFLARSIQVCPHDFPFSGWYGYNSMMGTLESPAEGVVRPYTIRRIEAFLKWAQAKFPVDTARIIPVGGDGAGLMALYRPELFAYVIGMGFESRQLDPKAAGEFAEAWGPQSEQIKNDKGLADWTWGELDFVLAGRRLANVATKDDPVPTVPPDAPGYKIELPFFICSGASWGRDPGYARGRGRFYYALQGSRHGMHGAWGWNRPILPEKYTGLWQGLDLTNATPFPAITNGTTDGEGESRGGTNRGFAWRDVKETAEGFEFILAGAESTFDLTPRRLAKFKVAAGQKLAFEILPVEVQTYSRGAKPEPQTGEVVADANGLVTLKDLKMPRGWSLQIKLTAAK